MNAADPKSLFEVAQDVRKEHAEQSEKEPEKKAAEAEDNAPEEVEGDPPETLNEEAG